MDKKRIWVIACILEAVILGAVAFLVIKDIRNSKAVDTSISDWRSQYIEYNDGWYVNEEILQVDKPITVIYGPGINLSRGTYSIHINYECDYNQSCEASAGLNEDSFVKAGTAILSKNKSEIVYQITVKEDVEEFLVKIQYNGRGMLGIRDITITKDSMGSRKNFLSLLLLFLIVDIGFCFSKQIFRYRKIYMALLGITILSSLPLMINGIGNGHDLPFHLVRIEAIADSIHLSEWSIPVRISNLWYDGYGYPTSIYYGELLLYIPAFFRIMGFSVEAAYKIYVFLINAGTTITSYVCFSKIFQKKNIALLTCMAYVTATYRMVNLYVRAAVGEYSAMMFFPIVALAVYKIYTGNCENKIYKKNALLLAIGITGLIETHILSTEIVMFILILICFVFWKKTLRKNTLKIYIRAIMITLMLNLFFIVPFLDYYINVPVNIFEMKTAMIQRGGAYVAQYFSFFSDVCGANRIDISERMSLTPGLVLMAGLVLAFDFIINRKDNKTVRFYTMLSVLTLYMASDIFPWDFLAKKSFIGNILAQIEFPWRYLSITIIFLTFLLGNILELLLEYHGEEKICGIYRWIVSICILTSCWFVGNFYSDIGINHIYGTAELDMNYYGMEYLRVGSDKDELVHEISSTNMEEVSLLSRSGHHMELSCKGTDKEGMVEVPVFNYKGYFVCDEYGKKYEITDGNNNVIKFLLPPNYSGRVIVDFEPPWYWRCAEIISLVSVCTMFVMWGKRRYAEKKINRD